MWYSLHRINKNVLCYLLDCIKNAICYAVYLYWGQCRLLLPQWRLYPKLHNASTFTSLYCSRPQAALGFKLKPQSVNSMAPTTGTDVVLCTKITWLHFLKSPIFTFKQFIRRLDLNSNRQSVRQAHWTTDRTTLYLIAPIRLRLLKKSRSKAYFGPSSGWKTHVVTEARVRKHKQG